MDEEECEGCDECLAVEPLPSMRFSWPGLLVATFTMIAAFFVAVSEWWNDLANQFAMVHNRKIDRDEKRDVASEVLSDIERL